jgi:hypothetical protein
MNLLCLALALAFTCLLGFVSYVQLLYLESLRLIKREVPSLQYFRETLAEKMGLEIERGSLTFSLIKHVSLPLTGVFYLCALVRPGVEHWQSVLEAVGYNARLPQARPHCRLHLLSSFSASWVPHRKPVHNSSPNAGRNFLSQHHC